MLNNDRAESHTEVVLTVGTTQAVAHYNDAKIIGEVSKGLGEAMVSPPPPPTPHARV